MNILIGVLGCRDPIGSIKWVYVEEWDAMNLSKADRHVRRKAEAAREADVLDEPTTERMMCACGYEGEPLAIIRYSEWDTADFDLDCFICPKCGDM